MEHVWTRWLAMISMVLAIIGCASPPTSSAVSTAPESTQAPQVSLVAESASSPLTIVLSATSMAGNQARLVVAISSTLALDDVSIETTIDPALSIASGSIPEHDQFAEGETKTYEVVLQSSSATPSHVQIYTSAKEGSSSFGALDRIWFTAVNDRLETTAEPQNFTAVTESHTAGDISTAASDGATRDITHPRHGFTIAQIEELNSRLYIPNTAPDVDPGEPLVEQSIYLPLLSNNGDANSQKNSVEPPATPTSSSDAAEPADQTQQPAQSSDQPRSVESAPQSTTASSATIKGTLQFKDHEASPSGLSGTVLYKKIRRAFVSIEKQSGSNWQQVGTSYTSTSGTFSLSVANITGQTVRVTVCAAGPDSKNLIQVVDQEQGGLAWCYTPSKTIKATSTTDFGTQTTPDTHIDSGPFNIYDNALAAYDYLTAYASKPTVVLPIIWYPGFKPLLSNNSYYTSGRVNLNGQSNNGDQWDDAIILHEIGHWVQDKYAAYPPVNFTPPSHGFCQEGTADPYMEYAEGWANFFSSAVRSVSAQSDVKRNAIYYIDTFDDGGTIATSKAGLGNVIESPTTFDSTQAFDFRKGNFCEWQIAGALWDVIDSNADNHDTLQKSPSNVFKAFQTKFNGHYPWTINEWWYGWTNTPGNRSGSSFGSTQAMLDNFADHKIQVGFRIETTWGHNPPILSGDLWLPVEHRKEVNTSGENPDGSQYRQFPYAGMTYSAGPPPVETTWITSLYKGTYLYATLDYSGLAGDSGSPVFGANDARVIIYDGSNPVLRSTVVPFAKPANMYWWRVFNLDGASGAVTFINDFQEYYPSPYGGGGSSVAR